MCYGDGVPDLWSLNEDMPDGPDPFFSEITDTQIWEDDV